MKIFIFQAMSILLGFGIQAIITNFWGASIFGTYTIFISWIGLSSILTVPGLDTSVVFLLPRNSEDFSNQRRIIIFCFKTVLLLSAVVIFLLLAFGYKFLPLIGLPINASILLGIGIILFSVSKLIDSFLLGLKDSSAASYYGIARNGLRILFCVIILIFPGDIQTLIMVAVILECAITLLMKIQRLKKNHSEILYSAPKSIPLSAASIIAITIPLFGSGIIGNAYPYLDKAIMGALLPAAMVGIYKVAESLAGMNSVFVSPFISFWPYISKYYSEGRIDKLEEDYRTITLVIMTIAIPFSICFFELSGFFLSLFGAGFVEKGRTILIILMISSFVDAITGPAGAIMKMTRYSRLSFIVNSVALVLYVGMSPFLIRKYGIVGIAVVKCIAIVFENIANIILNAFLLKVFPYTKTHLKLFMSGIMILTIRLVYAKWILFHFTPWVVVVVEGLVFALLAVFILRRQLRDIIQILMSMAKERRQS